MIKILIWGQAVFAVLLVAALPLVPAPGASILLLPLSASAVDTVGARAVAGGALILQPGPTAGSLIVRGDPRRLRRALGGEPVLMVSAPVAICGNQE